MNGAELHQDPDLQADLEQLLATGPVAAFLAHGMSLALAGCIIDLDDVVADFLGEPQLPRIGFGGE